MRKGIYYAARAAGRAAVRERTRSRQAKERAMKKNPELFQNEISRMIQCNDLYETAKASNVNVNFFNV